jgi:hypothetical protein
MNYGGRLVWIRNTLQVSELECSAAYLDQARARSDLTVLTDLRPLPLRADGFLREFVDGLAR